MPRRIRIELEYDGAPFAGWQSQGGRARTIQDALEDAVEAVTGERVRVHGAGRTDAGVHAEGQVAAFTLEGPCALKADRFPFALNAHLPEQIAVLAARDVPPDFSPRHRTLGKSYRYRILNRHLRSGLWHNRAWRVGEPLDIHAMREAAAVLVGEHDFSSFRASGCASKHPVRRIYMLEVTRTGDWVDIRIFATAFLKQMVRNIVGTLVEIGRGHYPVSAMQEILAARDRCAAGPTAPACGLTLERVYYPDSPPPPELLVWVGKNE